MKTLTTDEIAEITHEANRVYCKSIGDNSQLPWEKAEDWQKESAINGVMFFIKHPEMTAEDGHINWMKEKEDGGWKYGKIKNPEEKTHPCMVEYSKLPIEQQIKDHIFQSIVLACM